MEQEKEKNSPKPKRIDPSKAFRVALAAHRGAFPVETLRGAAKHLYETLTPEQLESYARKPDLAKRITDKNKSLSRRRIQAKVT